MVRIPDPPPGLEPFPGYPELTADLPKLAVEIGSTARPCQSVAAGHRPRAPLATRSCASDKDATRMIPTRARGFSATVSLAKQVHT